MRQRLTTMMRASSLPENLRRMSLRGDQRVGSPGKLSFWEACSRKMMTLCSREYWLLLEMF
jgi:hypothetical protein